MAGSVGRLFQMVRRPQAADCPVRDCFKQLYLCQSDLVDFYQAALAENDFLTKLKAKTCDFQGITLPVYHRLVRPGESSLTDLLRTYLRVFHPDTFFAAKALLMRVRSLRGGERTKGSDVS